MWGFPGGAVVENPPANAGDTAYYGNVHNKSYLLSSDHILLIWCIFKILLDTVEIFLFHDIFK